MFEPDLTIGIQTVKKQRYDTIGDYFWTALSDGRKHLQINVTPLGDRRYEFLVGLHELVESFLCEERGISEPDIMAFDKAVPDDSPYADNPGHDPKAPYHKEHVFAECIERLVAKELGVNWQDYERAMEAL